MAAPAPLQLQLRQSLAFRHDLTTKACSVGGGGRTLNRARRSLQYRYCVTLRGDNHRTIPGPKWYQYTIPYQPSFYSHSPKSHARTRPREG